MNADMATTKFDNDARRLNNNADIYGLHQQNRLLSLTNYTNSPESVICVVCSGVAHVGISDHSLVYLCVPQGIFWSSQATYFYDLKEF